MRAAGLGLVVTSGGLGPTADDLTAEVVGRFCGREMVLDEALEGRIAKILEPLMKRWPGIDQEMVRVSNRKQAVVPSGATVLEPVGTAPGLVVAPADGIDGPTVIVLPGPPGELQPMWRTAVQTDAFAAATAGATEYRREIVRLFGIPESEIAGTLRAAEQDGLELGALEITTCLRRGEIEIATRFEPSAQGDYDAFIAFVSGRHADTLFSRDGSTIDELLAGLLAGETIATAESCTAGGLAYRLTDRPGSSAYVLGGRGRLLQRGQDRPGRRRCRADRAGGAVSVEVAEALADGIAARFGAAGGRHHRRGRARRRHRGQAGRDGVRVRVPPRRAPAHPPRPAAGLAAGRPRPVDHRDHAHAAPAAAAGRATPGPVPGESWRCGGGPCGCSSRSSCPTVRAGRLAAWRGRSWRSPACVRSPPRACTSRCASWARWRRVEVLDRTRSPGRLRARAVPVSVSDLVWLPPRRPRVLAVDRRTGAGLTALQSRVASALVAGGLVPAETDRSWGTSRWRGCGAARIGFRSAVACGGPKLRARPTPSRYRSRLGSGPARTRLWRGLRWPQRPGDHGRWSPTPRCGSDDDEQAVPRRRTGRPYVDGRGRGAAPDPGRPQPDPAARAVVGRVYQRRAPHPPAARRRDRLGRRAPRVGRSSAIGDRATICAARSRSSWPTPAAGTDAYRTLRDDRRPGSAPARTRRAATGDRRGRGQRRPRARTRPWTRSRAAMRRRPAGEPERRPRPCRIRWVLARARCRGTCSSNLQNVIKRRAAARRCAPRNLRAGTGEPPRRGASAAPASASRARSSDATAGPPALSHPTPSGRIGTVL